MWKLNKTYVISGNFGYKCSSSSQGYRATGGERFLENYNINFWNCCKQLNAPVISILDDGQNIFLPNILTLKATWDSQGPMFVPRYAHSPQIFIIAIGFLCWCPMQHPNIQILKSRGFLKN